MSNLTLTLSSIQNRAFKAIELSKVTLIVWTLQTFKDMKPYVEKQQELKALPLGTAGRAIADLLEEHNMRFIPGFENHDLKHLVLGYGMNTKDELRMQAYLLGNGNRTLPCILFLTLGVLTPSIWKELHEEYKKGKAGKSILELSLNDCAERNLNELRREYRNLITD
jgi:hypothetical protein